MGAADGLDQGEGVGGLRERGAGVVDGGVEVLQGEDPPGALAQLGEPGQGPGGTEPHRRGDHVRGDDGQALVVEPGAVDVEPGAVEPLGDPHRLPGGPQQLLGAAGVGQGAADVAGHRGERRAGPGEGVDVLGGPVPDLDLEPEVGDPPDPLLERQVEKHHLRGHRQPERAHLATSWVETGRPVFTDSAAASAIASAARASSPPTGTGDPARTASTNAANSATYASARSSWSLRTVSTDRPAAPEKTMPVRRPSPISAIPPEPRTSPRTS